MIICVCAGVSDSFLLNKYTDQSSEQLSLELLQQKYNICLNCKCCYEEVTSLITSINSKINKKEI